MKDYQSSRIANPQLLSRKIKSGAMFTDNHTSPGIAFAGEICNNFSYFGNIFYYSVFDI